MNQANGPLWPNGFTTAMSSSLALGQLPALQSPYGGKGANMDTESVLSGYSERSKKSRNGNATYASLLGNSAIISPSTMGANQASSASPLVINPYHAALQSNNNNSGQLSNNVTGP